MDYLKELLKKTGWVSIIESLLFIIIGIILVWQKDAIMSMIIYMLGIITILIGTIKTINFIHSKGYSDLTNNELVLAIMSIITGIVIMVYSSTVSKIFGIIVGMWIVYSSIVRANSALKLKALNNNVWIYSLIVAIMMSISGLVVIFNTGVIIEVIGTIMIIYAVLDIIENIVFIENVKKLS